MSAPELVPIGTLSATLAGDLIMVPSGPKGARIIAEVDRAVVEGDRLSATMMGRASADWATVAPDGTYATLDVRMTLQTHDDAVLFVEYSGKIDFATGRAVSAPLVQTGDERYDWLNRVQLLGDGTLNQETNELVYELYEVRPT